MARFAAAISTHGSAPTAVGEVVAQIAERLDGRPTLAVLFITEAHVRQAEDIAATVQTLLEPDALIGSSAVAVLANGQGAESVPAVSLWAGRLDGEVTPLALQVRQGTEGLEVRGFDHEAAVTARSALLIPDPFTFPASEFLGRLGQVHPRLVVLGGFASAGRQAGDNRLILNGTVRTSGAVGVLLDADISPDAVVSQGCRPIGQPFVVTKARGNLILQLGGRPALEVIQDMVSDLPEQDQARLHNSLLIGRVVNEYKDRFGRSDFLIRNIIGVDKDLKAIAVTDIVRPGITVQLQLRDAQTATEDLLMLLDAQQLHARPLGALLFTCNGRGTRLFPTPNHDAARIITAFAGARPGEEAAKAGEVIGFRPGMLPLAGFFAAGEIGPVGEESHLHGQTACAVLFRA